MRGRRRYRIRRTSGGPRRDPGGLVELTRFPQRFDADVLVARLRSEGLRAEVFASDAGGWASHLNFSTGARVMVHESDIDDARRLTAE